MGGQGEHEDDEQVQRSAAVRQRVAPDEHGREQVAGRQDVRVHEQAHDGVAVREGEQRGRVQQPEAADRQQRGDGGFGEDAQRPAAQEPAQPPGGVDGQRAQRERDRGAEDEEQRPEHAEQQVTGHVRGPARPRGRGERTGDGGRGDDAARDPRHRAQHRPGASPAPGTDEERPVRDEADERDQRAEDAQQVDPGVVLVGHVPTWAARALRDPWRERRVRTTPARRRTTATTFQVTS